MIQHDERKWSATRRWARRVVVTGSGALATFGLMALLDTTAASADGLDVPPILEPVAAPVTAVVDSLVVVEGPSDSLPINPVADPAPPVLAPVTDLIPPVTDLIAPVTDLIPPVTDLIPPVNAPIVDSVVAPVTDAAAPVVQVVNSLAEPVVDHGVVADAIAPVVIEAPVARSAQPSSPAIANAVPPVLARGQLDAVEAQAPIVLTEATLTPPSDLAAATGSTAPADRMVPIAESVTFDSQAAAVDAVGRSLSDVLPLPSSGALAGLLGGGLPAPSLPSPGELPVGVLAGSVLAMAAVGWWWAITSMGWRSTLLVSLLDRPG